MLMRILFLFFLLVSLSNCKKNSKDTFNTKDQTLIAQADLTSGPSNHSASGQVKIYEKTGVYSLVFSNFKTDNGPDLRLYFSATTAYIGATEITELTQTEGEFFYTLSGYDPTKKTLLIWCKQASVLFGSATFP